MKCSCPKCKFKWDIESHPGERMRADPYCRRCGYPDYKKFATGPTDQLDRPLSREEINDMISVTEEEARGRAR